tara:strand:- start:97 stop:1023 length:927 start_codon:yes stop_codon:yes gene_type:complete
MKPNVYLVITLALATFLPQDVVNAQSDRDKRHARIQERLKESTDLEYAYFAPSVHIRYHHPSPDETVLAYYNEIKVEESMTHTYFATIGFDVGYFGIQDHGSGPLAIFSVWDKGGGAHDSSSVDEADRTQVLFSHPEAKSSRFGGEGSGAKTMMPFAWEKGETYAFLVKLTPQEKGTLYTAWISEQGKEWKKIASYQTVMTKKKLTGFYSFVEDYARNGETGQKARLAWYPKQGVMTTDRKWARISNGTGTIADDVIQNGHSGVRDNTFFSQSGAGTADYDPKKKEFSVTLDRSELELELPIDFFSKE